MTSFKKSLKQIAANRLNALKSTGPRTEEGKQRSRQNAWRHGLTAETVITALEQAADYHAFEASIASDYRPRSATERELVSRLASVLWRLRRSTAIETGLFQVQGELMRDQSAGSPRRAVPLPQWYDELDVVASAASRYSIEPDDPDGRPSDSPQMLACCFLRVSRLGLGAFDLLSRYETALWRQAAQILIMLQSDRRMG
jgi:hypothetical protein